MDTVSVVVVVVGVEVGVEVEVVVEVEVEVGVVKESSGHRREAPGLERYADEGFYEGEDFPVRDPS